MQLDFTGEKKSEMSFLVSNHSGSFGLFGIKSRFQGVFFSESNSVFKTIAHIDLKGEPGKLLNELWKVTRERSGVQESFWFAHRLPVFFYELSEPVTADIILDCRENFDSRVWGRNYDLSFENNCLLVHYSKRDDSRETNGEYDFWLAFHGCEFEKLEKWEEQVYPFDEQRSSPPFSRWVLRAFKARGSFVMSFAKSKSDAVKLAVDSWKRKSRLAGEAEGYSSSIIANVSGKGEVLTANQCASYSLACLHAAVGLYAGLPWFHQRWARDELISVKGLLLSNQFSLAKVILFDWLDKLLPIGRLPGTMTDTVADSGWLFLRFEDVLDLLNKRERKVVLDKLDWYLSEIESSLENGFVVNSARETWMDSVDRSGARIEINALVLAACRLYKKLKSAHSLEAKLKKSVRSAFLKSDYLADGSDDSTVRSNVFIAAYAYPELLSKKEWIACFDHIIPRLWLVWGGFSTVDKSDERFVKRHSGENALSYHNGDSWFWINNLAAIVLNNFGSKYKSYVRHILNASTVEILKQGVIGHHAELSSAERLRSEGSPVQAWSAATYVELVDCLTKSKS